MKVLRLISYSHGMYCSLDVYFLREFLNQLRDSRVESVFRGKTVQISSLNKL